ncbi:MAG: polysaccharide deacetylase [Candidatus Viridilinea halotolerans]|uniref:Polysaccharide deacetylase n=1 Tax=Candidatus Viridilinea halotolerans TaxID=2491704 RepID=A0A426TQ82_9CHLR|nr:MAG: polysaccharide deacetylase [Candidatus Viridilinea halotolerans]
MASVIPFQLVVGGRDAAGYGLRATAAGRVAECRLDLPPLPTDPHALGLMLGQALFPPPVRQMLIDVARGADEAGARLQIQLSVAAPELVALPWEWAALGEQSPWRPAVRDDYALMRVGRQARPRPTLPVAGPVRLLIACAPGAAAAAAAPLGHALAPAVRSGGLVVDLLRDTDPVSLREALAEEPCHALHLVAADATGIGSAARLRFGRLVDATGLSNLLADYRDLRLLTLAADLGAEAAALASLAAELHESLGLATITLGDLDNGQAANFCGPCYAALSAGDPVDLAVTDGRVALEANNELWGAPRLWAVPGAERLFVSMPVHETPAPAQRRNPSDDDDEGELVAPVGTPVRSRRKSTNWEQTAQQALTKARSFVVDVTTVGKPAQRPRTTPGPRPQLKLQVVILIVASLALVLIVSQLLVLPTETPMVPTPIPTPTLPRFLP